MKVITDGAGMIVCVGGTQHTCTIHSHCVGRTYIGGTHTFTLCWRDTTHLHNTFTNKQACAQSSQAYRTYSCPYTGLFSLFHCWPPNLLAFVALCWGNCVCVCLCAFMCLCVCMSLHVHPPLPLCLDIKSRQMR